MSVSQTTGGCYTCRFKLPEAQIQNALDRFLRAGREAVVCQRLLAIEFSDRFDALFITISSGEEGMQDAVAQVAAEFERLDSRRTLVLNGLRRHLASHGIAHREKAVGHWDTQSGSATSGIHVGPILTRLVADNEPTEALVRLVSNNWLPELAIEQARELVQATVPLPDPARWKSDEEIQGLFAPGILALDCRALEGDGDLPREPAALLQVLAPTREAPGQVLVNRLVERLGPARFSVDLLGKGEAQLEFSDKLDHYRIHPRSKKLDREIALTGADAALDRHAKEFLRLDQGRSRTLRLLSSVMAQGGYFADEDGDCVWFGKTHRLAKFGRGRALTLALRHRSPEALIQEWLTLHHLTSPVPTEVELQTLETTTPAEPLQRWLPAEPPERWDRLPKLADLDSKDLDRRAAESVAEALREAGKEPGISRIGDTEDLLHLWAIPFWFRPGDGWASEEFWLSYAEAAWRGTRSQLAAVLLVRAGKCPEDLDPEDLLRQHPEWWSEAFEDAFVWHFVDRLPWAIDEGDYPKFPHRFRPRPPQVVRRAVRAFRESFARFIGATAKNDRWLWLPEALGALVEVDRESASVWIRPEELSELETHLRNWAGEADFVGNDWEAAFVVAAEFGWHWFPAALSNNPRFIPAQFFREDLHSAPGETALQLSWVEPCAMAARFAADALGEQSPAILEQRARTFAGGSEFYESGREIVRNCLMVDRFAAAIAWQRCRAGGVC